MPNARRSSLAREYMSTLLRWWWLIVATVCFSGGYEVVNYVLGLAGYQFAPPRWVGWTLGAVALVIAQFLAFREMRKQRNAAEDKQAISRPRVKLSAAIVEWRGNPVTHFVAENFGEFVAINVTSAIEIPHTNRVLSVRLSELAPNRPCSFLPELRIDGEVATSGRDNFPLEHFMKDARVEWYAGRAQEAVQRRNGGTSADPISDYQIELDASFVEVGERVGTPLGGPMSIPFTVEYSNFDRTERWTSTHVLTYDPRKTLPYSDGAGIRIDLTEPPDAQVSGLSVDVASLAGA